MARLWWIYQLESTEQKTQKYIHMSCILLYWTVAKHATIRIYSYHDCNTYTVHTVTCDTSNSRTVAGTDATAGNGAISYTVLSSIAVHAANNNWHITRTKLRSIDGIATYKWQQVIRSNSFTSSTLMYKTVPINNSPYDELNSCLQITPASLLSQELWQMVPQRFPKHTSTLPSRFELPLTKRMSPRVHLVVVGLTVTNKQVLTTLCWAPC